MTSDNAREELARLREACTRENDEICQVLGKALGYPWFKDDQVNFPGATEENGVCVGDHVAITLAMEAAKRLAAGYEKRTPAGEGAGVAEVRLWWLLHIMERAGGVVDATDTPHSPLNAFCDDAEPTDTFNLATQRKLIRVTHDSDMDTSVAYLNDAGHAYLAARASRAPAADASGVGR